MDWCKQHADTIAILTVFFGCFWTLNEKINTMDKDIAIIKTVLVMRNIMPNELALHESEK